MKISNETKVGILSIVAISLFIIGFNFLKGKDVFNRSKKIYAVFDDLGSLDKSNEVRINGLAIGKVYDLKPKDKDVTGIVVTINLTRDVNIPDNSVAYISAGLVGASFIIIEKGDSKKYLQPGDTLNTKTVPGVIGDFRAQLNPTLLKVRESLDSLKTIFGNVNKLFNSEAKGNLQQTIANLNQASSSLNAILDKQTGTLARTLNNANAITENFKKNGDSITALISNAKKVSEKLSQIDFDKVIDSIQTAVSSLKATMAKLSSPNGTLGALINDKELYNRLNETIIKAQILLDDVREHPKRYVNLSIFGKKDKTGPLTSPSKIDSTPHKGN